MSLESIAHLETASLESTTHLEQPKLPQEGSRPGMSGLGQWGAELGTINNHVNENQLWPKALSFLKRFCASHNDLVT